MKHRGIQRKLVDTAITIESQMRLMTVTNSITYSAYSNEKIQNSKANYMVARRQSLNLVRSLGYYL